MGTLKSLKKLRARHLAITEDFYVSCFMKGLKEEIRAPVQLFRPRNLTAAMSQARLLENTLEIWSRKGNLDHLWPNLAMGTRGAISQYQTLRITMLLQLESNQVCHLRDCPGLSITKEERKDCVSIAMTKILVWTQMC